MLPQSKGREDGVKGVVGCQGGQARQGRSRPLPELALQKADGADYGADGSVAGRRGAEW